MTYSTGQKRATRACVSNTHAPETFLGFARHTLTTYTQATHSPANPTVRADLTTPASACNGVRLTNPTIRLLTIPGTSFLKAPPAPCPYSTKNSCTTLGSTTKLKLNPTHRADTIGFKRTGASDATRRKFITHEARMHSCSAFSSKIRAQDTALSKFSSMANTTKPPRCAPGWITLRQNEISAAFPKHTTAGM